jgi:hypothetical protein
VERLLAWYRVGSSVGAVVALLAANLLPLFGVLFLGWSVWTILTVYWLENGIVGFYNVLKMAVVPGIGKIGVIPFFILHYGMFWFVHGVFVQTIPELTGVGTPVNPSVLPIEPFGPDDTFFILVDNATSAAVDPSGVVLAGIGLFISHGVSFVFNFLRRGERLKTSAMELMFAPYGRVVILHLTILFGAFAVAAFGAHLFPLLILICLKAAIDLGFHLREHRAAEAAPLQGPPSAAS